MLWGIIVAFLFGNYLMIFPESYISEIKKGLWTSRKTWLDWEHSHAIIRILGIILMVLSLVALNVSKKI